MNPTSLPADAPRSRKKPWRLLAVVVCIHAAFAAAYFTKDRSPPPAKVEAAKPVKKTAAEILARIPLVDTGSDTDKALAKIVGRVKATPEKPRGWVDLGDVLAQKMRDTSNPAFYGHAESAYLQALEIDGASVDAMTGMAWVTGGQHLFDSSVGWANKALAIDPEHIAATGIIGDAALEFGDYDKAFDSYQKMMDLRPDLSSWSRGAHLLWLTGDKMGGAWLMEKAIKAGAPFGENTAWCRANLAMMHFQAGALLPAQQVLEPAVQKESRNPHVLMAAARVAAAKLDYPAALGFCDKLLSAGPHHDALVLKGDLHAAAGEAAEAEECYKAVEELHTASEAKGGHDHLQMARFYADHDRNPVVALRMAEEHKLTKNVLEADVLAWVYFKNSDLKSAATAMKTALSQNTPDAEMRYHAGMIAAAQGHTRAAKKHLLQALGQNPQFNVLQAPIARKTLESLSGANTTAVGVAEPSPVTR